MRARRGAETYYKQLVGDGLGSSALATSIELADSISAANASVRLNWVPRTSNTWADQLSKGDFPGWDTQTGGA